MPSLDAYKTYYNEPTQSGREKKYDSDLIMEERWYEDIEAQTAYLYDYYHDEHITKLTDLKPSRDRKKIPIDIKYIVSSSQTFDKDQITYHIQLKPSQECNVSYYKEFFGERYNSVFPCGLYIDIMDNKGKYNRWMVVDGANYYDPQFSTYEILPCDYVFQWIMDGKKYQVPGVLRSQNS